MFVARRLEILIRIVVISWMIFLAWNLQAQDYFNYYKPLQCKGAVPLDFSKSTKQKIEDDPHNDKQQLSSKRYNYFIEQIHYSIDEILHSGLVTFGDTVSQYLQRLGDRLLINQPELKGKLRFYSYNASTANAFSTRQGIVVVSTGFIAQVTSEAQLAFVLAHEIIHYKKQHVLNLFSFATKRRFTSRKERTRLLNSYNRENELEADKFAVEMMLDAGFSPDEINKTFDVLLYSYLPFEEMKFYNSDLGSTHMYIPDNIFPFSPNEISAKFKYNDYLQSHPNLEKRKNQVNEQVQLFQNWSNLRFTDSAQFAFIRNVARFEFVSNKLYENKPIDALFAILILEKSYPKSIFLHKAKAQAWLDIMKQTLSPNLNPNIQRIYFANTFQVRNSNFEGQISILNNFISSLPNTGKIAMGLRTIYDFYLANSSNQEFQNFWNTAIEIAAKSDDFNPKFFSKLNYKQTVELFEKQAKDSAHLKNTSLNKYQIIENLTKGIESFKTIDSTKFYLYGLSDLIQDSTFLKQIKSRKEFYQDKEKEADALNKLTDEERKIYNENLKNKSLKLGLDSLIFLSPTVYEMGKKKSIKVYKTLRTNELLCEVSKNEAEKLKLNYQFLGLDGRNTLSTHEWNDLLFLKNALTRAITDYNADFFVFDLAQLHQIRDRYGISKLIYVEYQHAYKPNLKFGNVALFTVLLPVGLFYFPIELLSANKSDWQFYVFDLNKGEIILEKQVLTSDPSMKHALGSNIYALFSNLKLAHAEK